MPDHASRLAPRSAGAGADLELLRVARTGLDAPEAPVGRTSALRMRSLSVLRRALPPEPWIDGVVRIGHRD